MTRFQAIQKLDARAVALKDDLMRYWEMAGLTEDERDRSVSAVARLFDALRSATVRKSLAPSSESKERP